MSDLSIPGVTASKYKTDELIDGLMKVERVPRDRADTDLKTYKNQQSAWRDINQHATTLRDSAKSLYSYNNPFTEKKASSTNEEAVTASPGKDAKDQSFKVSVSQVAGSDSFLSAEIPQNKTVPQGNYEFKVGEKTVSFSWKGGAVKDFVDAINRRATGMLRSSIIQVTDKTQAILIESLKTGSRERLSFSGDALTFALDAGFIKKNDSSSITPAITSLNAAPVTNKTIELSVPVRAKDGMVLEYTLTQNNDPTQAETTNVDSAPDTGNPGSITYGGITVANAQAETALSEPVTPPVQESVTDLSVLSLRSTKGIAIPLPDLPENVNKTTVTVPLSEYGDVNAILVHNRNTNKSVMIENIKIYDPKAAGDYIPVNPVSVAQDAILKYEGIAITRNTNEIADLVPGVTINVHDTTTKTETLTIKPDTAPAKEAIIALVANSNRVVAGINILTQDKPEIINEIEYFTDAEKKTAEEQLGMMMGDSTLNGLKSSLQRISSSSYKSATDNSFTMLSQIGISTKSTAGAGVESSRLRGYLEIDEKKLDDALSNKILDVKTLFGSDSDGDLIIDTGIGKALDANVTPYVQSGGILATRTTGLATKISTTEKKIAELDVQLDDKKAALKSKYGQMEGTLNSLQNQSSSISNFTKQNSN